MFHVKQINFMAFTKRKKKFHKSHKISTILKICFT